MHTGGGEGSVCCCSGSIAFVNWSAGGQGGGSPTQGRLRDPGAVQNCRCGCQVLPRAESPDWLRLHGQTLSLRDAVFLCQPVAAQDKHGAFWCGRRGHPLRNHFLAQLSFASCPRCHFLFVAEMCPPPPSPTRFAASHQGGGGGQAGGTKVLRMIEPTRRERQEEQGGGGGGGGRAGGGAGTEWESGTGMGTEMGTRTGEEEWKGGGGGGVTTATGTTVLMADGEGV